jgi:hypothetical protein
MEAGFKSLPLQAQYDQLKYCQNRIRELQLTKVQKIETDPGVLMKINYTMKLNDLQNKIDAEKALQAL